MCSSMKSFLKFLILAVNIPILIVGLVSLGTGIWVVVNEDSFFSTYSYIVDFTVIDREFIREGAIVLLSCGAATALFALIGIAAARSNSTYLLGFYVIMICFLIAVEVAAVTLGIIFKERWESQLDNNVLLKINNTYNEDDASSFTSSLKLLHQNEKCCGWRNASDFMYATNWNKTLENGDEMVVPKSCCSSENVTEMLLCSLNPSVNNSYIATGCKAAVEKVFTDYQGIVIGLGVCILVLEMLMVMVAVWLLTHAVKNKYDLN
ncbi:hypothetical protein LOTGIDRAFT_167900 [Lottia gigantea]|uniref:Tetraspanin n=1 Tax=Lottia gigantea TaxID=225164 RepID=V3Z3U2_LOTGI|nr:hypothetical protein LOTGIDRAFT_167900 [Lottia gigantea]ESO85323.1 hypothetical protein LOTGIDRAFT_167900 [Lottia gigantea]